MPNKEILRVEIDDSEFSEFKKKFDAYEAAVKAMPEKWQAAGAEISAQKPHFEQMADSIRGQAQELVNLVSDHGKINALLEGTGVALAGMAKSGRNFAGSIFQATASLRHWTKLTALFSGLIGAGGLFGISRMAESVARNRTSAIGLGVTYGERASFLANFGRLGNTEGLLQGFSEAETQVGSKFALRNYLGHGESGDPARDFAEGLLRFKDLVDRTPKEMLGPALQQRGYDKLGLTPETALGIRSMPRAEIEQISRGYGADLATRLGLSPEISKKWTEFTTKLEKAGEDIDTTLWKGLGKLAKPFEHLSEGFEHLVAALMRDGSPISGWIKQAGEGISAFAEDLGSGRTRTFADALIRDVAAVARLFDEIVNKGPGIGALLGLLGARKAAQWLGRPAVAIGEALAGSALGTGAAAAVGAGAVGLGMNKLMPQHPERLRRGQEYENAGGSPTSPHPAATAGHFRQARAIFGHPHISHPHIDKGIHTTAAPPAAPGTPWNHQLGEPTPLEVIHGTTRGVDQRLMRSVAAGAANLPPGYKVKIFSGYRAGDRGAHGRGQAIDVEIVDPKGNVIPSRGGDATGMYSRLARSTYGEMQHKYPDLAGHMAWGGSFGTQKGGGGVSDLMHFDIMGRRGGIRRSHYPQIQSMGPLPLPERTLGGYIHGHTAKPSSRRDSFGHRGHHPATISHAQQHTMIEDQTGGMVSVAGDSSSYGRHSTGAGEQFRHAADFYRAKPEHFQPMIGNVEDRRFEGPLRGGLLPDVPDAPLRGHIAQRLRGQGHPLGPYHPSGLTPIGQSMDDYLEMMNQKKQEELRKYLKDKPIPTS